MNDDDAPARERFDWLRSTRNRRSNLRDVRRAVVADWGMDEATRADLVKVLGGLLDSGGLPPREVIRVAGVLASMSRANARAIL